MYRIEKIIQMNEGMTEEMTKVEIKRRRIVYFLIFIVWQLHCDMDLCDDDDVVDDDDININTHLYVSLCCSRTKTMKDA